jgi:hypothetical protein
VTPLPFISFDRPMILLDDIVRILDLPDLDGRFPLGVDDLEGGQIRPSFIHGHGLGHPVPIDGFLEVTACCRLVAMRPQQEIDRIASLVHRAIQVLPLAAHLDVVFIHPPALADRTFVLAKGFLEQRYGLITQRCTLEWATSKPRSAIISSRFRKLSD